MNGSLVPANTKKSMLILGMFRLVPDLLILVLGIIISVALLLIFSSASTLALILCCIPMLVALVLVLPIPNYHNTLCAIQSVLNFYNGRRKFIWRGWCMISEYSNEK